MIIPRLDDQLCDQCSANTSILLGVLFQNKYDIKFEEIKCLHFTFYVYVSFQGALDNNFAGKSLFDNEMKWDTRSNLSNAHLSMITL